MSSFWATDDGWPYADTVDDVMELDGEPDDELLSLLTSHHVLDGLDDTERRVVAARFGLGGGRVCTMKELQASTGMPRDVLRSALGSGLEKLRVNLGVDGAGVLKG